MNIEIDDDDIESAEHAIKCAIVYTTDRMRTGVNSPHPERKDMDWYSKFEDDLNVAKSLKRILDSIEASKCFL